ncbi:MAG: butyrate kinase [Bacteroidales bacterium]|nr:butyrate kinase [Bacteroidales bacterium]MDD4670232.1 butyrate kinase [Bacteroidales bacterium]
MKILSINPGSTSTKIALYNNRDEVFSKTLRHSAEEIAKYRSVIEQYEFRKKMILEALKENGIEIAELSAIVGRGGLLKPIPSGVYEVNDNMVADLRSASYGEHASNLGGILARELAKDAKGCRAFIADPVVVDELSDIARITGHPLFKRISIFHALNQKAIAKMYAAFKGVPYESLNLIVVHLGGGVSVGAHYKGQVIDVNNALNGDGPFSPERSGTLPALQLADMCFSGKYSFDEVKKIISGKGGTVAHLGTNNFAEIEDKAQSDPHFKLISDAFVYNVAKEIGAMAVVMKGKVDAILITGGIAHGTHLMEQLSDYVRFIAPVKIYPGEDEMAALAMNGLAVMEGKEKAKIY